MPITVRCACGSSYRLKDELAGKVVKCPKCGEHLAVERTYGESGTPLDPAFDRDKFLLRQKHLSISEKYVIWDEAGSPVLYVVRPAHLFHNLLAAFAGIAAAIAVILGFVGLSTLVSSEPVQAVLVLLGLFGGLAALVAVAFALSRKRDVTFYRDETLGDRLLQILQDKKLQFPIGTYTLLADDGEVLARFRKNYLYNFFRKRWQCQSPSGELLCLAKEDSILLSMLRRLLGPFFGILRTNFIILRKDTDEVIGEFNRKFTILDRYVLDMTSDPDRTLDRRIAIALGVLLDSGEKR